MKIFVAIAVLSLASVAYAQTDPLEAAVAQQAAAQAPGAAMVAPLFRTSGEKTEWFIPLEAGKCYWFSGSAGGKVGKLALYLWGPTGILRLTSAKSTSGLAVMAHCAKVGGMYKVLAKLDGQGRCVMGLFAKDAPPEPVARAAKSDNPSAAGPATPGPAWSVGVGVGGIGLIGVGSGSGTGGVAPQAPGPAPGPAAMIVWPGTWSVTMAYDVVCTFGGMARNQGTQEHTDTVVVSEAGSGFAASAGTNYRLTGTGDDHGLVLSGQYPMRDHRGEVASGIVERDNRVTIRIEQILSASRATGAVSGSYRNSFGSACTIQNGSVTFAR